VWHEGRLYFCTGADEQKAVNIERNPRVAITTGNNRWKQGLDVVIEGTAVRIDDDSRLQVLADLWRSKYSGDWDYEVRNGVFIHGVGEALVFEVPPLKVLSFAKGRFAQTRYRF
jgi:nitroimidazol reductase NimA-like FMN-containing flavoprotein (pyridoxamine 5'-phosphate oxidase superfamily)